ncbi:hypothetical protein F5884DRAFT_74678 [Xylogone sp. PMI_703]|nr:hypothetical protein F5884DRAFT_74678 [Xylogone sp. PMI_703]
MQDAVAVGLRASGRGTYQLDSASLKERKKMERSGGEKREREGRKEGWTDEEKEREREGGESRRSQDGELCVFDAGGWGVVVVVAGGWMDGRTVDKRATSDGRAYRRSVGCRKWWKVLRSLKVESLRCGPSPRTVWRLAGCAAAASWQSRALAPIPCPGGVPCRRAALALVRRHLGKLQSAWGGWSVDVRWVGAAALWCVVPSPSCCWRWCLVLLVLVLVFLSFLRSVASLIAGPEQEERSGKKQRRDKKEKFTEGQSTGKKGNFCLLVLSRTRQARAAAASTERQGKLSLRQYGGTK